MPSRSQLGPANVELSWPRLRSPGSGSRRKTTTTSREENCSAGSDEEPQTACCLAPSWRRPISKMARLMLAVSLIASLSAAVGSDELVESANKLSGHLRFEFQRYDGWYNNLANSDWGTPYSRLRRKVAPAYSDGVYQMADEGRPSARKLSQAMMRGEDGLGSRRNLTTMFAFFGQVISSEILMASESGCPIEMHRIKIDKCDPMYDRECRGGRTMPFYRAAYDSSTGQSPNSPREQVNRVTSWIDGSFVYSTSETWLNAMRAFDGRGRLKMVGSASADPRLASALPAEELLAGLQGAVSLFGYPIRNKKRAPLINQMPAHHLKMKTAERMFLLGDPRTNQNPMLLAFGILFYRWHNILAERIHQQHPDWSDEEIFQRARRLVIASLQNVFLYEYLPTLLDTPSPYELATGSAVSNTTITRQQRPNQLEDAEDPHDLIKPYDGYKPDLHPGVSHAFQSAAFRFGHTLIPPGLYLRDEKCRFLDTPAGFKGLRLCSTWWNAEEVVSKVGVEQLLMGAASQVSEREDYVLCNDVRDKLFGPLDFSRRDLAALNIMRGRDNGLADYNTVRAAFQLPRVKRWQDINPRLFEREPELFDELARLYDNRLDRLDVYVAGMLESDLDRGRPGPLFRRIIKEQFERLRDSDRFWFENLETGVFSAEEVAEIRQITLYDIIVNATLIPDHAIQHQVFVHANQDPCPQPGQLSSAQLQPCYIIKGHSYFKGSELTYAIVCLTLVLIPIVCWLLSRLLVAQQIRKRTHYKAQLESRKASKGNSNNTNKPDADEDKFFAAKEWLHSQLKRKIKLRFGPNNIIFVRDQRGQVQRKLELSQQASSLVVQLSSDHAHTEPVPLQSAGGSQAEAGSEMQPRDLEKVRHLNSTGQVDPLAEFQLDEPTEHKPMVLLRAAKNYDLVLQFSDVGERRRFVVKLHRYLSSIDKRMSLFRVPHDLMLANAETKERRQQRLEHFFREAYALTFGLETTKTSGGSTTNHQPNQTNDVGLVMRTSLSRQEFAEALGMKADSMFVRQMFNCIDRDGNGRISFQEFLDTVVLFSRGSADDKLRIVFDMCRAADQQQHQTKPEEAVIEKSELVRMLRSLVDMAKTSSLSERGVNQMIDRMFESVGLQEKPLLTYNDFKLIISSNSAAFAAATSDSLVIEQPLPVGKTQQTSVSFEADNQQAREIANNRKHNQVLGEQLLSIGLDMKGAKRNFFVQTQPPSLTSGDLDGSPEQPETKRDHRRHRRLTLVESGALVRRSSPTAPRDNRWPVQGGSNNRKSTQKSLLERWRSVAAELEEHRQDIVYLLMFFVVVGVLFFERFVMYGYLSEHMDLRHVMGVGIAITRASAASLSFCYAMLLLSMCRNLMTRVRTMGLGEYIPLDSNVRFHKIVAMTALIMTLLHSIGHCVNFFHVTQQPVEHLRCLTKEMQFSGESRPTFFYWIFQTVTGSSGLALWVLCAILYVFARPYVRQHAYSLFWSTHKLYYLIYALTLLHGSSKLTGSPRFWIFFIIPAALFTIDKIISLQTTLLQLEILDTECLPSDVVSLKFARPPSFHFLSGQWIRLACTSFRPHEFHAFTLTSAPQDDFLSVHVRAQGPWTWKLRRLFDPANLAAGSERNQLANKLPPRIRIEGPFGGGNQDWYKYEVAVMIGGGIGVTPYASILNDLVFGTSTRRHSGVAYKKVYFVWICPSHRNFEWFIDVLKEVERKDVTNVLEMHIFITQFFHKFDLRTTMLYICENHFQRISNRSLFTGLKAVNHFGRPDIEALLQHVQNEHSTVNKVGVFSCGPKAMIKSISKGCEKVNKRRKKPFFLHQYENFS